MTRPTVRENLICIVMSLSLNSYLKGSMLYVTGNIFCRSGQCLIDPKISNLDDLAPIIRFVFECQKPLIVSR